jgi:hypothetical protein
MIGARSDVSVEDCSPVRGAARFFQEARRYSSATQSFECVKVWLAMRSSFSLVLNRWASMQRRGSMSNTSGRCL